VRIPELGLRVLNAHAVYNTEERESHDYQGFRRCVDAIERYCENYEGPLLVVGDFNASVHLNYDVLQFRALFQRLAEMGLHDQACDEACAESLAGTCRRQHEPTRTYRAKDYRIDYIFANDAARPMTSSSRVGEHGGLSDHRPVFAEVRVG
jgi:endonuclease/exonuclease/phosphatase (EEP) superfamily protein YafD